MRSHSSIIYNVTGQTVSFVPPVAELILDGAATSAATYVAHRGSTSADDTEAFSGTATLDSTSTLVAVSSGMSQTNRKRLYVSTVTTVSVGDTLLLENVDGQREIITVARVNVASAFVDLEQELSFDYAVSTGNLVKGIAHTLTVPTSFVQDSGNINVFGARARLRDTFTAPEAAAAPPYRIKWQYSIASLTRQSYTYLDLVRQQAKHGVSGDDLLELCPDLALCEWQGQRGQRFLKQIDAGWERLQLDVRLAGYDVDAIREGPVLDEMVRKAALWVIGETGWSPNGWDVQAWATEKRNDYLKTFSRAIGDGLHVWMDTGTAGAITRDPRPQPRLRS